MPERPQKDVIREIWQGMYGVKGTSDNGMVEDVKVIKSHLSILNGAVKTNTAWRKIIAGVGGTSLLALIGVVVKLLLG